MKSRTRKIGKIASIAASEESRFGQIAGRSQQQLQEQQDRLGELNAFRQNYTKKSDIGSTVSSAHWRDYQDFLHRLDTAVNAQQQIVRDCERKLEIHRQRWMAKRQRLRSLERVLEKCEAEEQIREARKEQKRLDELPNSPAIGFDADKD